MDDVMQVCVMFDVWCEQGVDWFDFVWFYWIDVFEWCVVVFDGVVCVLFDVWLVMLIDGFVVFVVSVDDDVEVMCEMG